MSRIGIGEENDIADDGEGGRGEDEGSTATGAFRDHGESDCENGGDRIRWYRQQLSVGRGEAEIRYDGRLQNVSSSRTRRSGRGRPTRKSDKVYNGRLIVWNAKP